MSGEAPVDTLQIGIEKLVYGGDGLGRLESGEVIFVPWSAPGDKLEIARLSGKQKPAKGQIIQTVSPGPERQQPPCSVFGTCGGCQWQHITPAAQREWKRKIVQESLERLGKLKDINVLPTIGSDETAWHYRNRVQWEVRDGVLGYHGVDPQAIVRFDHCWNIPEDLNKLADWLAADFREDPPGGITRFETFINSDNQILLSLYGEPDEYHKPFSQSLREEFPNVLGLVYLPEGEILSGEGSITETVAGKRYQVSAGSFFQTNRLATEALLSVMEEMLEPQLNGLLDLYAGVGVFALHFKDRASRILAIEGSERAMTDAAENCRTHHAEHVSLKTGDVQKVLRELRDDFGTAIIDPPRTGCQPEILTWLSKHIMTQLIYVSCNPTTLARDLKILTEAGWRVESVQPIDMFPQTYHIETVVNLRR